MTPVSNQDRFGEPQPTVTIFCLAFNHAEFIAECLNGMLEQVTDFPVEIIVHDDASNDATPAILRTYSEKYPTLIRLILQNENQFSRGRHIEPLIYKHARGRYIAWCDGDGRLLDPFKLVKQVRYLEEHPDTVLSYHDALMIDEAERVVQDHNLPAKWRRDYSQAELRVLHTGWIMFSSLVHRNVGIDFPPEYDLVRNTDNFFHMLLAQYGRAKFQGEVSPYAYRLHAGGVWSRKSPGEHARMHLQTYLQIANYFVRIGEVDSARTILRTRLVQEANAYLNSAQD